MNIAMLKDIIRYGLSILIIKGTSILMLPLVTRYLSPKEYGQLELLTVTCSFIALVVSCSLHEALYRFASSDELGQNNELKLKKSKKRADHIFSLAVFFSFCLFLLILIASIFLQKELSAIAAHFEIELINIAILCVSLCIGSSLSISLAWLRVLNKVKSFTRISITSVLIQAALVLSGLELGMGVSGVLAAAAITHLIQWCWLVKLTQLKLCMPPKASIKKILIYSLPLSCSALIAFGLNGAERWLILNSSNLEMLGQYSIANKFAIAACILVQPFCMWWMPKRFAMLETDPKKVETITLLGIVYIAALIIVIAALTQIFAPMILIAEYQPAIYLTLGSLFMIFGKELTELLNLGLLYKKQTQSLLKINIVTTFFGMLTCLFFADNGVWSVMICIGIAQLLKTYWVFRTSEQCYPIFSHAWLMLFIPLVAILALVALYFAKTLALICSLSAFFLLLLGGISLHLVIKKTERPFAFGK